MEASGSDISQHFDRFIKEIEAIDNYCAPTFRSIYDGGAHDRFLECLEARIRSHDRNIERMCNVHYQGFIDSIRELLQVRTQAQQLRELVVGTDKEIQQAADGLITRMTDLCKVRRVACNASAAAQSLAQCLPALRAYSKLQQQTKDKSYYLALKSLELLEHTLLPQMPPYCFARHMKDSVPKLRESIKEASLLDLNEFLDNVRKVAPTIGATAIRHTSEQMLGTPTQKGLDDEDEEFSSAQHKVDFSPVYCCLHIYTVLGARETLVSYYRAQRKEQAWLAAEPPPDLQKQLEGYEQYLHGIVGFLVVEDHLLSTATDVVLPCRDEGGSSKTDVAVTPLVDRAHLDEVWSIVQAKVVSTLSNRLACLTDADAVVRLRDTINLFCHTLRSYGYNVTEVLSVLSEVRRHYEEILCLLSGQLFCQVISEDNFQPLQVWSEDEYRSLPPVLIPKNSTLTFPCKMPFSAAVPEVLKIIQDFASKCALFCSEMSLSKSESEDCVRRATNTLISRHLGEALIKMARSLSSSTNSNTSLSHLVQLAHNASCLESGLKITLTEYTSSGKENASSQPLLASRAAVEEQVCRRLRQQVEQLVTEGGALSTSDALNTHPSQYMLRVIVFLESACKELDPLPNRVWQAAVKGACFHLCSLLVSALLQEEEAAGKNASLSLNALQQLDVDLVACERFAQQCLRREDASACFAELRQLLDLFLRWDWDTYFGQQQKSNGQAGLNGSPSHHASGEARYAKVPPQRALQLMERLRDPDKKSVMSLLKKSERDRKREMVLKQLRQLAGAEAVQDLDTANGE